MGRRTVLWGLFGVLLWTTNVIGAETTPVRITARSALVMDIVTGSLLWEHNAHERVPPASTTKILTTMLALESGRLDESFPVSARAQAADPSKLALRAGERVELRDLVYALMLKSANDAAVVVAEGLGGSVERFADRMNERARRAGAVSSTFQNPHGLPDPDHLTTARDLGMIMRAALQVPGFRGVASTSTRAIHVTPTKATAKVKTVSLRSKNRLLTGYRVPVIGKTGYTRAARRCFVGAASRNGHDVIVVVLGASDLWGDVRKLVDWGLEADAPSEPTPLLQVASQTIPVPPPPPPVPVSATSEVRSVKSKRVYSDTPKRVASVSKPKTASRSTRRTASAERARLTKTAERTRQAKAKVSAAKVSASVARATRPSAVQVSSGSSSPPPTKAKAPVRRGCTGSGCGASSAGVP